ncbi:hypothetical protein A5675_17345 [Mycobacterium malmoense]|nr:hypothetical protein A5675_17345 [Mycobacterium malmoense]
METLTMTLSRLADETDRGETFRRYLDSTVEYNAAIETAGDEPWHAGDVERRRELFNRRYTRPAPPEGLTVPNIGRVR